jgi:hypothetical protein
MRCPVCRKGPRDKTGFLVYVEAECPVCLEKTSPLVALPCGHVICQDDFKTIGGILPGEEEQCRPVEASRNTTSSTGGNAERGVLDEMRQWSRNRRERATDLVARIREQAAQFDSPTEQLPCLDVGYMRRNSRCRNGLLPSTAES